MAIYPDPFGALVDGGRQARADYLDETGEIRRQRAMDLELVHSVMQPAVTYERDKRLFQQRMDELDRRNAYDEQQTQFRMDYEAQNQRDAAMTQAIINGQITGPFAEEFMRRRFPGMGPATIQRYNPVTGQIETVTTYSTAGTAGTYGTTGGSVDRGTGITTYTPPPVVPSSASPYVPGMDAAPALGASAAVPGSPPVASPTASVPQPAYLDPAPAYTVPYAVPETVLESSANQAGRFWEWVNSGRSPEEQLVGLDRYSITRQSRAAALNRRAEYAGREGPAIPWWLYSDDTVPPILSDVRREDIDIMRRRSPDQQPDWLTTLYSGVTQ